MTRGTPIMSEAWITECWQHREDPSASAVKLPLSRYTQLPFTGCTIALHGFQPEEEEEMKEIAANNGKGLCMWVSVVCAVCFGRGKRCCLVSFLLVMNDISRVVRSKT